MNHRGFTTSIIHSDRLGKPEHGSLHKPIHTSIAYGYEKAEDLAAVFQGTADLATIATGAPETTADDTAVPATTLPGDGATDATLPIVDPASNLQGIVPPDDPSCV